MLNKIQNLNYLLIFLIILISFIGAAGLYSAAGGSYNPWASRHLIRLAFFIFLAVILALLNIKYIYQFAYVFFILSLLLLLSVELIGVFGKGATRWINVFGFSIQPSELIKITIILALARFYHDLKFDEVKRIKNLFFPILILFLPFALVVIQPDLGTALSIAMLGILILFASGIKIWKFVLGFFVLILLIPLSLNYLQPYQKDRIFSFLNPEADALGRGYQLIQSKIALGSGGLTGKGFLEGSQSYLQY